MKTKSYSAKMVTTPFTGQLEPERLLLGIRNIWEAAQTHAVRAVDTEHVKANWLIGCQIVEAQQGGKKRAGYGEQLLRFLSENLFREYGTGFSISSLKYMRLFYKAYPELLSSKRQPSGDELKVTVKRHPVGDQSALLSNWTPGHLHSQLCWRHYWALTKVDNLEARNFYEIEAIRNNWSGRQLERQIA